MDETELGIYGIITATLGILIYIIGFDFYVFNTREIVNNKNEAGPKIINQLVFHLIGYIAIIPIMMILIVNLEFLDKEYFYLFPFLIIAEHLGQELYRLYTTYEKSIQANAFLFLRNGLWVWLVFYDFFVAKNDIALEKYVSYWLAFSLISLIISLFYLNYKILKDIDLFKNVRIDFDWIKGGLKVAGLFFISSLSFQIIQVSDRFMIDFYQGKKEVGIYTLYSQFANVLEVFVFTGVTMIYYPKLLQKISNATEYKSTIIEFKKKLFLIAISLVIIFIVIVPKLLVFMDKKSFLNEIEVFYVLLLGGFIFAQSHVYHYDLFVKKKDSVLVKIALFAAILNILVNIVLIPIVGILGAAIATLTSFLFILILKMYHVKKVKQDFLA